MKRILLGCLLLTSLVFTSCKKNNQITASSIEVPQNEKLTVKGENGILVTAEDVYSNKTEFKRKIIIFDPNSETTFPAIYLKFKSASQTENIYSQLKEDRSSVSGLFTVEIAGSEILSQRIVKGEEMPMSRVNKAINGTFGSYSNISGAPIKDLKVSCTVTTVHDCVSYQIDDMNAVDYAFCLAGAPACYAQTWASCYYDVCNRKIRYTNPY